MREIFAGMKNIELLEEGVTIRSAVKEAQEASLEALAEKSLLPYNKRQDKKVKIIYFFVSLIEEFSKFL